MPRRKPAVYARRQYSIDLKQCIIIYQAHTLGKTSTEISIDLDVPLRVVQRSSRLGITSDVSAAPESSWGGIHYCPPNKPSIYLDEIQELLQKLHGIKISVSSIWRTLKRLGMSAKKLTWVAAG
ncbi:hypothetical protein EDB85DRAFT_507402 [Lactarius pseudohatsudake]|nr:hypothetical protein EDB85DRAFT_507402 [Lactarius pseudohatsudake]